MIWLGSVACRGFELELKDQIERGERGSYRFAGRDPSRYVEASDLEHGVHQGTCIS